MTIRVDALDGEPGVVVRDEVAGEQFPLRTDRPVDPESASTEAFTMPVDAAVAVEAAELGTPAFTDVIFWRDGEVVDRATSEESADELPRDTYEVDFSPPGVKLYVRIEDAEPTVRFPESRATLDFGEATRLVLGVRSMHESPAGTVTVTEDPRDLMRAVSTFGSALKTQTPDRSWPTLRGHPPALELGDALHVPAEVEPPETGVRIEVPPEYGAIYTVAPLAYYLGASVVPGSRPRVVADGETRELDSRALAESVRSVLEHVFTLDCVVREAGVYPFQTAMSEELTARVALDRERLFELSLSERTAAYLRIPRSATEGLVAWHYTADVAAAPSYAAALPYLVDELALVRSPPQRASTAELTPSPNALQADGVLVRSATPESSPSAVVVPDDVKTPGHSWSTSSSAVDAANPTVGSFQRPFSSTEGDGALDVHVVFNDARLQQGDVSLFDSHPYRETDVRVSRSLSTAELREALYEETDYLHFVGHVTDDGMVCPDGVLDTRTLAKTGVSAFFLNGCRSYEQGRALLTAGATAGIVTVDDVADDDARSVGETVAVLLSAGFPLYGILHTLSLTGTPADRYTILGDDRSSLRHSQSAISVLPAVDTGTASAPWPLSVHHFPHADSGIGALASYTYTDAPADVYDASVTETALSQHVLEELLADSGVPVLVDGEVHLTDDLSVERFR